MSRFRALVAAVATVVAAGAATSPATATAQVPAAHDVVPAFQAGPAHDGDLSALSVEPPLALRWRRDLEGSASYPIVANGIAYTAVAETVTDGGWSTSLYAVDLLTGRDAWGPVQVAGESHAASLAYDAGVVVVATYEGLIRGYDAANGALRWTYEPPFSRICCGEVDIVDLVTARDGVAYVSAHVNSRPVLTAVDVRTGAARWAVPSEYGTPTVGTGVVYVGATCTAAKAHSAVDGTVLWSRPARQQDYPPCDVGFGGMTSALHDGRLYVRSTPYLDRGYDAAPGAVLDAATGAELRSLAPHLELPAFAGSTGYHVRRRLLTAHDERTGGELWSFAGDGTLIGSPLVVGDHVVVTGETGTVFLVDRETGDQVWSGDAGGRFSSLTSPYIYTMLPGLSFGDGVLLTAASNVLSAWESAASPASPPPPAPEPAGTATPGPLVATESTAYQIGARHDGHQRFDGIAAPLVPAWRHDFGGELSFPIAAAGRVFVVHCQRDYGAPCEIEARDAATGAPLWGPIVTASETRFPYLGYGSGTLVVVEGHRIKAYDAATGGLRWDVPYGPYTFPRPLTGEPVVTDGRVYVSNEYGLRALDLAAGTVVWTGTGTGFSLRGAPAADAGRVYADHSYGFGVRDGATGTLLWEHRGTDEYHEQTHVVSGDRLFYGDGTADRAMVFDRTDGTILGEYETVAVPAVDGERAYLRQADRIGAFDLADGRPAWVRSAPDGYAGAPVVANGQVFVRTRGAVEALEAATGRLVWRGAIDGPFTWPRHFGDARAAMAVAGGRLFVPVGGTLYVFADPRLGPAGPTDRTLLSASQATVSVDAGSPVTMLGRLRRPDGTPVAGRPVELWSAADGSTAYRRVATVLTDARGEAWFRPVPGSNTRYALRHPSGGGVAASSGRTLRVTVRYVTSVAAASSAPTGSRLAVRVGTSPGRAGSTVLVERYSAGRWVRAGLARTGAGGAALFRVDVRRGANWYRVRVLADRSLAASTPRDVYVGGT